MYTVNQGPSKLVAKTRPGLSQNYDKIETIRKIKVNNAQLTKANANNDSRQVPSNIASDNAMDINVAKPVFQQYRRSNTNRSNSSYINGGVRITCFQDDEPQPDVSPQYEELIQYIRNSWNVLSTEHDDTKEQSSSSSSTVRSSMDSLISNQNTNKKVIVYHNDAPSPMLEDFGPFDLESWWGRRLFNNITKSL